MIVLSYNTMLSTMQRRRINTEEKAKVVATVWWDKLI